MLMNLQMGFGLAVVGGCVSTVFGSAGSLMEALPKVPIVKQHEDEVALRVISISGRIMQNMLPAAAFGCAAWLISPVLGAVSFAATLLVPLGLDLAKQKIPSLGHVDTLRDVVLKITNFVFGTFFSSLVLMQHLSPTLGVLTAAVAMGAAQFAPKLVELGCA